MYNRRLHYHFIGIGGSGMSGLARILLEMGFIVSGSDIKASHVCQQLSAAGAIISYGHHADNIPAETSLVVYSSAIRETNPEMQAAKERKLTIIRRAEVLAELMRLKFAVGVAGSHGKTTTTSMLGVILDHAGFDPTVVIGGIVKAFGTGGRLGRGDYLVAETDESDRSFLLLKPTIAVVTNIDDEHINAYSSPEDLNDSFEQFITAVPFYGLVVLCIDDPRVRAISSKIKRRQITYGFSPDANLQPLNIEQIESLSCYDLQLNGEVVERIKLPLPGRHLVLNSLAAIAVGLEFGISIQQIKEALASFEGVSRRLEVLGTHSGITVVDDYAHHPTELRASIAAVKEGWLKNSKGRLIVVHQPHRYSRVRDCFAEYLSAFDQADQVILGDIYAASEDPIEGINSAELCRRCNHPNITHFTEQEFNACKISLLARTGDVILCMGAGPITNLAHEIFNELSMRPALIA